MGFNTVIFYDIENLLRGYSFSQQMITNLSLKEILESIIQTGKTGQIAVQRAYANWSDPRLAILRGEINELGIDPIQVFGFSREQKKNAADIQLAIEAIDLAHVRPALEVFVIFSGDGGFASLAKKLHEYGKTVIGCAYKSAANKIFQAVCDEFVWIADPEEEDKLEKQSIQSQINGQPEVNDPRNVRLTRNIKKLTINTHENIIAKTREILNWYSKDPLCRSDLANNKMYLSVVQEAIKYAIPDFQSIRLGFAKFIEYVQFVCNGTDFCIVRPVGSQAVVTLRNMIKSDIEVLPDLNQRDLHSVDNYKTILAIGSPTFRLPSLTEIEIVAANIAQSPIERVDLGIAIETIVANLNNTISSASVKLALLSFLSAGVFEREAENVQLSELKLSLRKDIRSTSEIIELLKVSANQKLKSVLSEVKEDILQMIIPYKSL